MTKTTPYQGPTHVTFQDSVSTANLQQALNRGLGSANLTAALVAAPVAAQPAAQPAPAPSASTSKG
jgi:hypothetical protein